MNEGSGRGDSKQKGTEPEISLACRPKVTRV